MGTFVANTITEGSWLWDDGTRLESKFDAENAPIGSGKFTLASGKEFTGVYVDKIADRTSGELSRVWDGKEYTN